MRITTWNVNGLRAREGEVHDWVRLEQPDVLCLQEIKASLHQVPVSLAALDGYWWYWHGNGGYSGVALALSKAAVPVQPRFFHPEFDLENRIVCAELDDVIVASVYVPNGGKDFPAKMRFLEAMEQFVSGAHARGKKVVLCGDLNVALTPRDVHPELANPNQIGQTGPERALIDKLLGHGLVDLLRHFAPDDDRLFTWWAPWRNFREKNVGWRLDFVLASHGLLPKARSCRGFRDFGTSDHGPVMAVFDGTLFDAARITPGPQPRPPAPAPAKAPQLDLFK